MKQPLFHTKVDQLPEKKSIVVYWDLNICFFFPQFIFNNVAPLAEILQEDLHGQVITRHPAPPHPDDRLHQVPPRQGLPLHAP